MMVIWDDTDSSSSKKDEEYATNLCLIEGSKKDEVFDSESDLDFFNQKASEQAFDNFMIPKF